MTTTQLMALLPIIAAGALPVVLILAIAVRRSPGLTFGLTLAGLALVLAALIPAARLVPIRVTPLLTIDGLALYFIALAALAGAATVLLARTAADRNDQPPDQPSEELNVLVALAVLGAAVLGASRNLAALFLGLELISVSLFPLIAYARRRPEALEAGIKYLVLSSVATGLLLFGIALLYAGLGSLEFAAVGRALAASGGTGIWTLGGIALLLAGLGMKLSLAPLHWWTPDVYQGASAAVTGFLASAAKGAVVVVLLRLLAESGAQQQVPVMTALASIAVLSMLFGNLLALRQNDVKRILAYSSIAHMGYLLIALLVAGEIGAEAVGFYLAAYIVTTLGAFGAVALNGDRGELDAFRGLYRRRPWLAASMTLMLLSLAGIPVTAGFVGKFYLFAVGINADLWVPVAVLIATSIIGLFYYLRVILALYGRPAGTDLAPTPSIAGATGLALLTIALIGIGAWPQPMIALIRSALAGAL